MSAHIPDSRRPKACFPLDTAITGPRFREQQGCRQNLRQSRALECRGASVDASKALCAARWFPTVADTGYWGTPCGMVSPNNRSGTPSARTVGHTHCESVPRFLMLPRRQRRRLYPITESPRLFCAERSEVPRNPRDRLANCPRSAEVSFRKHGFPDRFSRSGWSRLAGTDMIATERTCEFF